MAVKEQHGEGNWGWSRGVRGQINADTMTHDELRNATNEVRITKGKKGVEGAGTLMYVMNFGKRYLFFLSPFPTLFFKNKKVRAWCGR